MWRKVLAPWLIKGEALRRRRRLWIIKSSRENSKYEFDASSCCCGECGCGPEYVSPPNRRTSLYMRDLPPPPLLIDLGCIIEIGIEDQCMRGDLSRKDENRVVLPLPSRGAKREKDKVKRNVIGREGIAQRSYLTFSF